MNNKRLTTDNPSGCTEGMLNNIYAKDSRAVIRFTEDARKNVDLCEYISEKCKCNYSAEDIMELGCGDCQMCPYGLMYSACTQAAELRERLKQYEDKEEQGLLLDLPCKVGDKVYIHCDTVNQIIPYDVEDIHIDNECIRFFATALDIYYAEFLDEKIFTVDNIGKTVFLTKEAALQALKECTE